MRYFSGFGFCGEEGLFSEFLAQGEYSIAGFSYGAQKALNEAFKRAQLRAFRLDSYAYLERFFVMCGGDEEARGYFTGGSEEELRELLYYEWRAEDFSLLQSLGIEIEILLGERDEIINSQVALEFFRPLATRVLWLKGKDHLLHA